MKERQEGEGCGAGLQLDPLGTVSSDSDKDKQATGDGSKLNGLGINTCAVKPGINNITVQV